MKIKANASRHQALSYDRMKDKERGRAPFDSWRMNCAVPPRAVEETPLATNEV
jgi:hypothetical protein